MRAKHAATLVRIFTKPVPANLRWADAESLLVALGADVPERVGSRVAVELNGRIIHLHRPHPSPNMKKAAVADLREFLKEAGVEP